MRIIALRSLLNSLVKDAGTDTERSHFQHVLEVLSAGPSSPHEQAAPLGIADHSHKQLPPFPPPDEPPPMSMIGTAQAPAPMVLKAQTIASAASCAELSTLVASEDEVAAVVASAVPSSVSPPLHMQISPPRAAPDHAEASAARACPSPPRHAQTSPPRAAIEPGVAQIMDLGFSAADAAEALKHGSDVQAAIEWLLARSS